VSIQQDELIALPHAQYVLDLSDNIGSADRYGLSDCQVKGSAAGT
jgi:hypothetical protein